MKLLFDTNMFIASEDISGEGIHVHANVATRVAESAARDGHRLFLLQDTSRDLERDENPGRAAARCTRPSGW